jgi:Bacterial surface proteins containing Ig-like domains
LASEKQPAARMAAKKPPKRRKLRNAEYYDMTEATDRLYAESQKGQTFANLVELIAAPENITYQTFAYENGWQKSVSNGTLSGSTGGSSVCAIRATVSGLIGYQVAYRAYINGIGWQEWKVTKNGTSIGSAAVAGSTSKKLGIEAIEMLIQKSPS